MTAIAVIVWFVKGRVWYENKFALKEGKILSNLIAIISLSIQSGKSTGVTFNLTKNGEKQPIELIKNKPKKLLGSIVTALNKPQDMFDFLFEKLNKKLQNIDNSTLRGEYKMKIQICPDIYALPSVCA